MDAYRAYVASKRCGNILSVGRLGMYTSLDLADQHHTHTRLQALRGVWVDIVALEGRRRQPMAEGALLSPCIIVVAHVHVPAEMLSRARSL